MSNYKQVNNLIEVRREQGFRTSSDVLKELGLSNGEHQLLKHMENKNRPVYFYYNRRTCERLLFRLLKLYRVNIKELYWCNLRVCKECDKYVENVNDENSILWGEKRKVCKCIRSYTHVINAKWYRFSKNLTRKEAIRVYEYKKRMEMDENG